MRCPYRIETMYKFSFAAVFFAAFLCGGSAAVGNDAEEIAAGKIFCPHCQLQNAELTNTCVKHGNLKEANFDGAHAALMCMSYADFTGASFRGTDLSGANLSFAKLDGADFTGATLTATLFKGTDLSRTRGLTQAQVDAACGDSATRLPSGLAVHRC
jgi:uncharacterized protein YjbI with pentapeptide repeats